MNEQIKSYNRFGFWMVLVVGLSVFLFVLWLSLGHAQTKKVVAVTVKDGGKTVATGTLETLWMDGITYQMTITLKGSTLIVSQSPIPPKIYINGSETQQFERIDIKTRK